MTRILPFLMLAFSVGCHHRTTFQYRVISPVPVKAEIGEFIKPLRFPTADPDVTEIVQFGRYSGGGCYFFREIYRGIGYIGGTQQDASSCFFVGHERIYRHRHSPNSTGGTIQKEIAQCAVEQPFGTFWTR